MEKSVNGIREVFFTDLIADYQEKRENSFLYRSFWIENVTGLLEEYFPRLPMAESLRPENESHIKKHLTNIMRERPQCAEGLLLKEPPGKKKERRDFWAELWLNDIGYKAGLIKDSEYYLWLVQYLAARDIYYKDNSTWDGHVYLYTLLFHGLKDTESRLEWNQFCRGGKNIRTKSQVGGDLAELARLIQEERKMTAGRLHHLKVSLKTENDRQRKLLDYLPMLTRQLERMALHIKIKTWLQDSGYPLRDKIPAKKSSKGPRKQDFSMRLFEAYCDSEEGYDFIRKNENSMAGSGSWRVDGLGFCIMDPDQIDSLLEALRQSQQENLYLPLAIDLFSGCIFFLAGKENYADIYTSAKESSKKKYKDTKTRFCFDYLRLDPKSLEGFSGNAGEMFRLEPFFHKNAGRSYKAVLDDFKRYCTIGENSPRNVVREFNMAKTAGIPDTFRWAFEA